MQQDNYNSMIKIFIIKLKILVEDLNSLTLVQDLIGYIFQFDVLGKRKEKIVTHIQTVYFWQRFNITSLSSSDH